MDELKFKIGTGLSSTEYIIKQTFRALLLYEEITNKVYEEDNKLGTQFTMLYCMLKASNKETFKYTYDEFINLLDDNQDSVNKFFEYLQRLSTPNKKKAVKQY